MKCLLVLFAFLGLFFGLVLAGETQEADAAKAKSKAWKYGYKTKGIVCGDKLCSEKYGKKIQ
ncbi:MAG: hypothetical protein HZC29_02060 [Thaumarchaeota archaeon]|nr:hypothetical protein [Nitrososphaerota archaeon]